MATLNTAMVEPEIPQSTGNVARTCVVTEVTLHLVGSMGFIIDDKKFKCAGLDYWYLLDTHYYAALSDFLKQDTGDLLCFSTKASRTYTRISYLDNSYLVLSKETTGLPEELL